MQRISRDRPGNPELEVVAAGCPGYNATRRNSSLAVARGFSVPTPKVPIAGSSTTLCVMPSLRMTPPRFKQTTGAGGRENLHKLLRQHIIAPDDWAICTGVPPRGAHANSLGLHNLHG